MKLIIDWCVSDGRQGCFYAFYDNDQWQILDASTEETKWPDTKLIQDAVACGAEILAYSGGGHWFAVKSSER